jgi:hypothetical protein
LLIGAVVLAGLAIEAFLIGRWAIGKQPNPIRYLLKFSCATLLAWLATFFALLDVLPSSG